MIDSKLKSRSKEKFEAKKPYDFDGNQNRSALSKKEQLNTTGIGIEISRFQGDTSGTV